MLITEFAFGEDEHGVTLSPELPDCSERRESLPGPMFEIYPRQGQLTAVDAPQPASAEDNECPYFPGNVLLLRVGTDPTSKHDLTVRARILRVFEPFTLSCVMVVEMASPVAGQPTRMVLKMFDRRFATQLRKESASVPAWTLNAEQEYWTFIESGGASAFITKLETRRPLFSSRPVDAEEDDEELDEDNWDNPRHEAELVWSSNKIYTQEVRAYDRLKSIQGKDIPRLFAHVTLPKHTSTPASLGPFRELVEIHGVLLEYIEGFSLSDLAQHAPKHTWSSICDDALGIVNSFWDLGVCNGDVHPRNCLVQPKSDGTYKVFMFDLGCSTCRKPDQDDFSWRKEKRAQEEEAWIGEAMEEFLNHEWKYEPSPRYRALRQDFDSGFNQYITYRSTHAEAGCCDWDCRSFDTLWQKRLDKFHEDLAIHKATECLDCNGSDMGVCQIFGSKWKEAYDTGLDGVKTKTHIKAIESEDLNVGLESDVEALSTNTELKGAARSPRSTATGSAQHCTQPTKLGSSPGSLTARASYSNVKMHHNVVHSATHTAQLEVSTNQSKFSATEDEGYHSIPTTPITIAPCHSPQQAESEPKTTPTTLVYVHELEAIDTPKENKQEHPAK